MRLLLTSEQKKEMILAFIAARGWCFTSIHPVEAQELRAEGKIKYATRHFTGGNRKPVFVAA